MPGSKAAARLKELLAGLKTVYERKDKLSDYEAELPYHKLLLPELKKTLGDSFVIQKAFGLGSTATVWEVLDPRLEQKRALKLSRPRLAKLGNIVRVVRAEPKVLAALNHQNIIKVYAAGEVEIAVGTEEFSFPYFVMEYLDGVEDLDEYILKRQARLEAGEVINYFRDVLTGLSFLHSQGIVHCDVKPGNLLIAPGRPALVADLGYAKHLLRPGGDSFTEVTHTPKYAHPELHKEVKDSSDSNAAVTLISRDKLHPRYDLFSFGRTMQEVLTALQRAETQDPEKELGYRSVFTQYQWLYLGFISKRLLDGVVERTNGHEFELDCIPGLDHDVMKEIKYSSAEHALEDFEKLLHLYDLEGEIPELNPNYSAFIQIPRCRVPLSHRVREVISHPSFARLAQVTQLGFVSLVYPGASHTRLEHVLGTFTHCCDYIRALWYDQENCLFQCVMTKKDIERLLLASLLHDIAQYPMAHDLTEIDDEFAHEPMTVSALERIPAGAEESLADIIALEWGVGIDDVLQILDAGKNSGFRNRLLRSIIDGPLDCDKLDYLKRVSAHLGVTFGLALDDERLVRSLTVVYESPYVGTVDPEGNHQQVPKLDVAEIGVADKALVVAQALLRTRKEMFTQVYWQHTARAMKAMLAYVGRQILDTIRKDSNTESVFWGAFRDFVFDPITYLRRNLPMETSSEEPPDPMPHTVFADEAAESASTFSYSCLAPTDDALLSFLASFSNDEAKAMLTSIRQRKLYKRIAILSPSRNKVAYDSLYDTFRTYRLEKMIDKIEEQRSNCESRIISRISEVLQKDLRLVPPGATVESVLSELDGTKPLVLVDIPIKATSRMTSTKYLYFLREDVWGVHGRRRISFPSFARSPLDIADTIFDLDVGKIRALAHPRWRNFIVRCLKEEEIIEIILGSAL
jgi:HD superfamily phosphohydrolase/RIO-like serine/threonine protein kinase